MEFEALDSEAIQLARDDVRALSTGGEPTLRHEQRDPDMARSVELLVDHEKGRTESFEDETRLATAIVRMQTDRDALVEEDVIGRARFAVADVEVMRRFAEIAAAVEEWREPVNVGGFDWLAEEAAVDPDLLKDVKRIAEGRYHLVNGDLQSEIREDLSTARRAGGEETVERLREADRRMGDWRGEIVVDRVRDALDMADDVEVARERAGVAAQAAALPKSAAAMPRGDAIAPGSLMDRMRDMGKGR